MKRMTAWIACLCILLFCLPFSVSAEQVDIQKESSLTLQYRYGEEVFPDLSIRTYRVAAVAPNGEMALTGAFVDYPINIDGIEEQSEWQRIATTFAAYILADNIEPTSDGITDAEGYVRFENLLPGMYLTLSVRVEKGSTLTVFETFLTVIPQPVNGAYVYDVTAYPKCEQQTVQPTLITHKVVKQWKDGGHTDLRPQGVTVDILRDGELQTTEVLSAENNWSYVWQAPDDGAKWQAVERDVAEHYTVSVEELDSTIVITNVYEHKDDAEQTGDIAMPQLYMLILCVAGLVLLLIAAYRKRLGI